MSGKKGPINGNNDFIKNLISILIWVLFRWQVLASEIGLGMKLFVLVIATIFVLASVGHNKPNRSNDNHHDDFVP